MRHLRSVVPVVPYPKLGSLSDEFDNLDAWNTYFDEEELISFDDEGVVFESWGGRIFEIWKDGLFDATDTSMVWGISIPDIMEFDLYLGNTHLQIDERFGGQSRVGLGGLGIDYFFDWRSDVDRWLRYRESDGTTYWEAAGQGEDWRELASYPTMADANGVYVDFNTYVNGPVSATGHLFSLNDPLAPYYVPPEPGDGGVGHSWFVVELTSEHVPDGPEPPDRPPFVPIPGPGVRRPRRERFENRFPGRYRVVKSVEQRFPGRVITPSRFAGRFEVVESGVQTFSATFRTSTLRATRREEEEFVLLMMDE